MHLGDEKCIQNFLSQTRNERDRVVYVNIGGRIIANTSRVVCRLDSVGSTKGPVMGSCGYGN
jgi:hypothetical protein